MAQILITEQEDGTYLVTRGRAQISVSRDKISAKREVSRAYEDGDTVSTVSKDGVITSITRQVLRSLTRNRSRTPRVRGGLVGVPKKTSKE